MEKREREKHFIGAVSGRVEVAVAQKYMKHNHRPQQPRAGTLIPLWGKGDTDPGQVSQGEGMRPLTAPPQSGIRRGSSFMNEISAYCNIEEAKKLISVLGFR